MALDLSLGARLMRKERSMKLISTLTTVAVAKWSARNGGIKT